MRENSQRRRPAAGSLAIRILLALVAAWLLAGVPEQLRVWDDISAGVIPSERTMPAWGNWAVGALMAGGIVALLAGWALRRGHFLRLTTPWRAVAWGVLAGLMVWTVVLAASQVGALDTDGTPSTVSPSVLNDGVFAIAALGSAAVVLRDLAALRQRAPASSR